MEKLEELARHLTSWATFAGSPEALTMSRFVWLHATIPAEPMPQPPRQDMIVLYANLRQRPEVVTYFVVCELAENGEKSFHEFPPVPFRFKLSTGPGRLCPSKSSMLSVQIC